MSSLHPFSLGLGVLLLVAGVVDLLWTTLWSDGGAGPLSVRLTTRTWDVFRAIGGNRPRVRSLVGPVVLLATLATWFGLIWAGWTFLIAGDETAIVSTQGSESVDWVDSVYFAGYAMFTLGNGGFAPTDGLWQVLTVLMSASGMLFITMGVSYVLSVLGAVVDKRSFASNVTALGDRSESLVLAGWNGEDFDGLELPLSTFASELGRLGKQHKAYPLLHFYHSRRREDSSAFAVATLYDAMTLLRFGVHEDHRPETPLVDAVCENTESFLDSLDDAEIQPRDEEPPPPDLDRLRDAGVPTVSDEAFADALDDVEQRRRKLHGLVVDDLRQWPNEPDQ